MFRNSAAFGLFILFGIGFGPQGFSHCPQDLAPFEVSEAQAWKQAREAFELVVVLSRNEQSILFEKAIDAVKVHSFEPVLKWVGTDLAKAQARLSEKRQVHLDGVEAFATQLKGQSTPEGVHDWIQTRLGEFTKRQQLLNAEMEKLREYSAKGSDTEPAATFRKVYSERMVSVLQAELSYVESLVGLIQGADHFSSTR